METINFRCPPELLEAAKRLAAAAGQSVGEWTRSLVEKETGIKVEVKLGMAGVDEDTRKRVERARLKGIQNRVNRKWNG